MERLSIKINTKINKLSREIEYILSDLDKELSSIKMTYVENKKEKNPWDEAWNTTSQSSKLIKEKYNQLRTLTAEKISLLKEGAKNSDINATSSGSHKRAISNRLYTVKAEIKKVDKTIAGFNDEKKALIEQAYKNREQMKRSSSGTNYQDNFRLEKLAIDQRYRALTSERSQYLSLLKYEKSLLNYN